MLTAHTPGPWLVGSPSGEVMTAGGIAIATPPEHLSLDDPQWRADALLIAAAPDLLAACEAWATGGLCVQGPKPRPGCGCDWHLARAAAAEARGRRRRA